MEMDEDSNIYQEQGSRVCCGARIYVGGAPQEPFWTRVAPGGKTSNSYGAGHRMPLIVEHEIREKPLDVEMEAAPNRSLAPRPPDGDGRRTVDRQGMLARA